MSKYEAVYFVGDNQAINRVRVDSYKTRNRGAFSGSLAALVNTPPNFQITCQGSVVLTNLVCLLGFSINFFFKMHFTCKLSTEKAFEYMLSTSLCI